jgi:hypothetical protein
MRDKTANDTTTTATITCIGGLLNGQKVAVDATRGHLRATYFLAYSDGAIIVLDDDPYVLDRVRRDAWGLYRRLEGTTYEFVPGALAVLDDIG